MRLIDADALKEAFYRKMKELLLSTDTPQISNEALSLLCGASLIADAPTIEERKTGKWIRMSDADGEFYACSECGDWSDKPKNYCSECGSYNGGNSHEDD